MATLHHHLNTLRQKPEHVRRRVAVGASAGITALVAVIWAGTLAATGAFSLGTGTTARAGTDAGSTDKGFALSGTNVNSNFSQLLGAVSAATSGSTTKPQLRIVDGGTSSSFTAGTQPSNRNGTNATVIPF